MQVSIKKYTKNRNLRIIWRELYRTHKILIKIRTIRVPQSLNQAKLYPPVIVKVDQNEKRNNESKFSLLIIIKT